MIVNVSTATFECSAPDLASCPDERLPEFAFIGRSNVGKSSLLNLLSGRQDLARVSRTPGFTKLINHFIINQRWRLVDLPGYGYAHVMRKHKARFNRAVTEYLQRRENLRCVFALIDSTLPPQDIDLEFVEWLTRNALPFVLVFTKTDRVKLSQVQANIEAFTDRIAAWFEKLPGIYKCSAVAGRGRRELLEVIEEILAEEEAETGPPPRAAGDPPEAQSPSRRKKSPRKPSKQRPWSLPRASNGISFYRRSQTAAAEPAVFCARTTDNHRVAGNSASSSLTVAACSGRLARFTFSPGSVRWSYSS